MHKIQSFMKKITMEYILSLLSHHDINIMKLPAQLFKKNVA